MEVKMIDMKDIKIHTGQCRETFDHEKLMELTNSIKESELLQPIVVRRIDGNKYGIVCGERRFRAFEYLHKKQIPAIIRDIKNDTDALEKSLIENLQRDDLTSEERENAIGILWDSGQYKTQEKLSDKLGYSNTNRYIKQILTARAERKRLKLGSDPTTGTINLTGGISDEPRKKLIEMVEDGKIKRGAYEVSAIVQKIKEFPEPKQQMEILEEFEQQEEQSKEIFDRVYQQHKDIKNGKREPEHYLEEEPAKMRADTIQSYCEYILKLTPSNIKKIDNKKYQEQTIEALKKTMDHIHKLLISLGKLEVIE